ncbi:Protein kinase-like [Parasponia andersonii]|uniref:Protein kinase-like n=1 Tax=Parasponia andersonii TaxID=3476 RepID=A0A2P5D8S8_PARAD|nr:Protein kinase-like [Parasponia andersonii]
MAFAPPYILCFFVLFLMLLCSSTAQTQSNISLGSSLTALDNNLSWQYQSGAFAFGFQKIGKDGFLLAIWFNKIPERTIVWSANGNNLVQEGSKVELTGSGLILCDTTGNPIWNSSIQEPELLMEPCSTQEILCWQTRQPIYGRVLENQQTLYTLSNGSQLTFNQSGFIYLEARNGTILSNISSSANSTQDFYQRATLEYGGVFRQYIYPKSNGQSFNGGNMSWIQSSTSIPSDICTSIAEETGGGACVFNSYCKLEDDNRPKCYCPDGYAAIDPNDSMRGCKPSFEAQSCDEGSTDADQFDFAIMESTNWPLGDYEHFQEVTEDWCKKACLSDCFCEPVIFNNISECWKKRSPFSNGMVNPSDSVGTKALIKTRKDNSTSGSTELNNKDHSRVLLIRFLGSSAFLNVPPLLGSLALFFYSRKVKGCFWYCFHRNSSIWQRQLMAIKKLDNKLDNMMKECEQEFKAEVSAIGRTNPKNLVQLIGFCNEGQH